MNLYEKVPCVTCKTLIERIDLFPNDNCLQCYRKTKASLKAYSNALWGKTVNKNI